MKKILSLLVATALVLAALSACSPAAQTPENTPTPAPGTPPPEEMPELIKIKVGASPTPHAQILAVAKELLLAQGYDLEIIEFTDYVMPNVALDEGSLDANYFQHQPYLTDYNAENGTDLVSIAAIHYEPFGIYAGKTLTLDALADGAQITVPNDSTNEARALALLEAQGLITLKEGVGSAATVNDIVDNPRNLKIVEIEAAQLVRSLQDVDFAVINGNYALAGGLNPTTDALAREEEGSMSATEFANILVVRAADVDKPELQALTAALQSPEVKAFIETNYQGDVVPVF